MKPVLNYPGYLVNADGIVHSKRPGRQVMKHTLDLSGYPYIRFYQNGKQSRYSCHRIVWEAFNGKPEKPLQVDHIDNDVMNYRLDNLQLLTPKQNTQKSILTGRGREARRKGGLARAKDVANWHYILKDR